MADTARRVLRTKQAGRVWRSAPVFARAQVPQRKSAKRKRRGLAAQRAFLSAVRTGVDALAGDFASTIKHACSLKVPACSKAHGGSAGHDVPPGCGALFLLRGLKPLAKSRPRPPLCLGCFVRWTRLGCAVHHHPARPRHRRGLCVRGDGGGKELRVPPDPHPDRKRLPDHQRVFHQRERGHGRGRHGPPHPADETGGPCLAQRSNFANIILDAPQKLAKRKRGHVTARTTSMHPVASGHFQATGVLDS